MQQTQERVAEVVHDAVEVTVDAFAVVGVDTVAASAEDTSVDQIKVGQMAGADGTRTLGQMLGKEPYHVQMVLEIVVVGPVLVLVVDP